MALGRCGHGGGPSRSCPMTSADGLTWCTRSESPRAEDDPVAHVGFAEVGASRRHVLGANGRRSAVVPFVRAAHPSVSQCPPALPLGRDPNPCLCWVTILLLGPACTWFHALRLGAHEGCWALDPRAPERANRAGGKGRRGQATAAGARAPPAGRPPNANATGRATCRGRKQSVSPAWADRRWLRPLEDVPPRRPAASEPKPAARSKRWRSSARGAHRDARR